MSIPDVRILGIVYKHLEHELMQSIPAHGCAEGQTTTLIGLNPSTGPDQQRQTSLHEITHVLDDRLKIGLGEGRVHRMSEALFHALRDNHAWVEWLLSEGENDGA